MVKVSINTYYQTALDLHKSGKLKEARKLYNEILKLKPNHFESRFMLGQTFYKEGSYDKALESFETGLEKHPGNIDFRFSKAKTFIKLNLLDQAHELLEKLLVEVPANQQILFQSARCLKEKGAIDQAILQYQKLLELNPKHVEALNNLGNIFQRIYQIDKSMDCYDRLIELDPKQAMFYCNKAGLLQLIGKYEESASLYNQAVQLDPKNSLAYFNLGVIQNAYSNPEKALDLIKKAISLSPDNYKYLAAYAGTLGNLGKKKEAIDFLEKLVATRTYNPEPYVRLAKIQIGNYQYRSVINLLEAHLKRNSYDWESMCLLGIVYELIKQFDEAEKWLLKVKDHPDYAVRANITLQMLYSKTGRFDKYDEMMEKVSLLLSDYLKSDRSIPELPVYNLAYYPFELEMATAVTRKFSTDHIRSIKPLREKLNFKYGPKSGRLKIGYLSPAFKRHPIGVLIQDTLESHNRDEFEIYAYGTNCLEDEVNRAIQGKVDQYYDVGELSLEDAARKINEDGIHILVSLAGYNLGMKSGIPALRPAPIQVVCLDTHESMQVDFYDYVLKDHEVITNENQKSFNESIAFLPPSHFFKSKLKPPNKETSKADYGLPEDKFIFGCLNHPRKVNPSILRVWINLLKKVPESVLWLFHDDIDLFRENVYEFSKSQGIGQDRVIFCGRESLDDHLNRMRFIDLFLDTSVYNGHTTCLEALWMEIPVLTIRGKTVSSRLCSSFLKALNFTDLVCDTEGDYIEKAMTFANDKTRIEEIKENLKQKKKNSEFFDTKVLTSKIEEAYRKMWEGYKEGKRTSNFEVH